MTESFQNLDDADPHPGITGIHVTGNEQGYFHVGRGAPSAYNTDKVVRNARIAKVIPVRKFHGMRLLWLLPVFLLSEAFPATPPNILLFMADDLTWHDHGCYGNADVRTPHIDRLAARGLRFEYCFNSAPMCAPTRMSLYTGIHPVRNGAHPNHSQVYPHIKSLPHHLKKLGYRVALLGKRHEMPAASFPFEFLGGRHHDNGKGTDLDLNQVEAFLRTSGAAPWCLLVTSNQPHTPWNRGDASAYDPDRLKLPPYLVDTPETREAMTRYYAEISYMDAQLGRCLEVLRESGRESDTLVIYLSEQGSNFPHCKWTCYDSGLRSACIIRWPGVAAENLTTPAMIQYVDVLPTLIEAAGGSLPKDLDGRSFLAVLRGLANQHRSHVFGLQTSRGIHNGPEAYGIRTIRDQRHRLIWNLNHEAEFRNSVTRGLAAYQSWERLGKTGDPFARSQWRRYQIRPEYEFYDLAADPGELRNLIDEPGLADRIAKMKSALAGWMAAQGDLGDATERAATQRQTRLIYR